MSRRRSTRNTKKPTKTKIIPSKKLKINRKTSKMVSPKEKVKSRRPSRMSFGEEHMGQLEEAFEVCNYPDVYMREGESEIENLF
ncbi:unnamed protein product [Meloidogyne enterolobii]|uniref:Uncharacterized protein n=1 Tax=Meloidogyne enterolobii TaxID=390850 RepID=A0ACB0ZG75_MELEN